MTRDPTLDPRPSSVPPPSPPDPRPSSSSASRPPTLVPPLVRIVDDDDSFRKAAGRMLKAAGFSVKAFSSAEEFLAGLEPEVPGCMLLDLQMPGLTGLELQDALAKDGHSIPIVFISGHGDVPAAAQAMRRGAEDFLTKTASKKDLLDAVRRALARDARERAEHARLQEVRSALAALSAREMEVLALVVEGKMNKEISDALQIHERTVKLHRTSITTKLGVPSVAELTRLWMEAGAGKK